MEMSHKKHESFWYICIYVSEDTAVTVFSVAVFCVPSCTHSIPVANSRVQSRN